MSPPRPQKCSHLGNGPDHPTPANVVRPTTENVRLAHHIRRRWVDPGELHARNRRERGSRTARSLGGGVAVRSWAVAAVFVLPTSTAGQRGPVSLANEIGRVRSVFKFGYEAGLLDRPVRFGPEFVKPPKRAMRQAKNERGERMFEAAEVRALVEAAGPQLKAMILLGVNCGMGNTDVAALTRGAADLKKGLLDFPRPKTGVPRRAVLWKEGGAAPGHGSGGGSGRSARDGSRRRSAPGRPSRRRRRSWPRRP